MSPAMSRPPLDSTTPPRKNTGTIRVMPVRMPQLSAIHPMKGSISSPGRIHSELIEKPIDLALGGIAKESAAMMPGPTIAKQSEMSTLEAIATPRLGVMAKTPASTEVTAETTARKRRMAPGSRSTRRLATRAPMTSPTSCPGSAVAATMPRARSSSP